MFSLLLGLTFLVEMFATQIEPRYFHWGNNSVFYNLFVVIEFNVYALFYYKIIQSKRMRNLIKGFAIVYPIFWFVCVFFVFGLNKWNSYVIIAGGMFTVVMALGYYNEILQSKNDLTLFSHPEFWIATGMLIFYSCQVPFYGMLNYLISNYLQLAKSLLRVLVIINCTMYLIFIYAFLCKRIHPKSL